MTHHHHLLNDTVTISPPTNYLTSDLITGVMKARAEGPVERMTEAMLTAEEPPPLDISMMYNLGKLEIPK